MGIKLIDKINAEQTAGLAEKKFPEFGAGDIVRVSIKIKEGDKYRVQVQRWYLAGRHRNGAHGSRPAALRRLERHGLLSLYRRPGIVADHPELLLQ